jgi:hypothetical protein
MAKHEAVLRIMRDADIRDLESNAPWLTTGERAELRRLKRDYYGEVRNRDVHPTLVIPGRGWQIRGPLMIAQVEEESLEDVRKSERKDIPLVPFGFLGDEWLKLKSRYQEGDEFYFFRSDERSWADLCGHEGYVLIHGNEQIGQIVTSMN